MRGSREGHGVRPLSLKNIGFLTNSIEEPLKNHKATKPAFNFGTPLARQRNAILIQMAFRWRADDFFKFYLSLFKEDSTFSDQR